MDTRADNGAGTGVDQPSLGSPLRIYPSMSNNMSTYSYSQRSVASSVDMSATQEAEVISRATTQAISAARSILLSGGTQSSALYTAKAAAESVLLPHSVSGERPPLNPSSGKGFFGRRKNKRQAEIIASVALVTANTGIQNPQTDPLLTSPLHSGMVINSPYAHLSGAYSEFTDDFTQHRSATPSMHGPIPTSQSSNAHNASPSSVRGLDRSISQTSATRNTKAPTSGLSITQFLNSSSSSSDNPVALNVNQAAAPTEQKVEVPSPPAAKAPVHSNFLDYFMKKQARADESVSPSSPKTSIPEEMPMPRSRSSKSKADLGMGKVGHHDPIYDTNVASPRHNVASLASSGSASTATKTNLTPDGSESDSQSSSTEGEFTNGSTNASPEEDNATKDTDSHFFGGTVDPIITSFNDVFSCGPDMGSPRAAQLQMRGDVDDTTMRKKGGYTGNEQRDGPQGTHTNLSRPRVLEHVDSATLLQDLRASEKFHKRQLKKAPSPPLQSQARGMSMENVVMRALGGVPISPPSRQKPTSRPTLNVGPATTKTPVAAAAADTKQKRDQQHRSMVKRATSMSAYSFDDGTPAPATAAAVAVAPKVTITESHLPPTMSAPMSSSSLSAYEPVGSGDDSSASEKKASSGHQTGKGGRKVPWFRRNKQATQADTE